MIPTFEQREERYRNAPSDVQELYAGDAIGPFLWSTFDAYQLREELYGDYALAYADVVLDFEEESHLPQLLVERVGLPEKLATIIAHDLLEYINTHKSSPPQPASSQIPEPSAPLAHLVSPEPVVPQWTRTTSGGGDQAPTENIPRFIPNAPLPNSNETIPTYRKPLTETPHYQESDPYREPQQ